MMCGEIVEQCAGNRGLANATLVRAHQDQCWFSHFDTLTNATTLRHHPLNLLLHSRAKVEKPDDSAPLMSLAFLPYL